MPTKTKKQLWQEYAAEVELYLADLRKWIASINDAGVTTKNAEAGNDSGENPNPPLPPKPPQ